MLFGKKKIHSFGLDISDSSIKIMQLASKKQGYWPVAFSSVEIPKTLIAGHMISDEQKLSEYIARAVQKAKGLTTEYVSVSVPEAKSFVRILTLPVMDASEINNSINWELEQDIPIPLEHVYLDWQIISSTPDKLLILVIATPKDYVDSLITAIKMAKLKPIAVELESQATARALIQPDQPENVATLIVDMSTSITSFAIVSGARNLEYTSNIDIGGANITASIATALKISEKEAEKIKIENGLTGDTKKGNVQQAILPTLDSIAGHIMEVVAYHQEHSQLKNPVRAVLLCGGGASLPGLADYFAARLNLGATKPVDRIILANPWVNVIGEQGIKGIKNFPVPIEQEMAYSTAIGLALREVDL